MEPYTKKMLRAWRQTVAAYERLIETGDARKWRSTYCHLCVASRTHYGYCVICASCILENCVAPGRLAKTMRELDEALEGGETSHIKRAARARLAAMKAVVNPKLKRRGQLENV